MIDVPHIQLCHRWCFSWLQSRQYISMARRRQNRSALCLKECLSQLCDHLLSVQSTMWRCKDRWIALTFDGLFMRDVVWCRPSLNWIRSDWAGYQTHRCVCRLESHTVTERKIAGGVTRHVACRSLHDRFFTSYRIDVTFLIVYSIYACVWMLSATVRLRCEQCKHTLTAFLYTKS